MFQYVASGPPANGDATDAIASSARGVDGDAASRVDPAVWVGELAHLDPAQWAATETQQNADAGIIDCIRSLEELKAAAAAAQARLTASFDASQRRRQAELGLSADELGKGIGAQIALARRESPACGSRYLGLAKALIHEMPHTLAVLTAGRLSEWRATILVQETACLTIEDRAAVDHEIAADADNLERLSNRALIAEARKAAYRLDPHSVARRAAKAVGERHVSGRPAPDTMAYLTALLPATQAVAVLAALTKAADTGRATGDPRRRGQLMADTLVERATGQARADGINLEVQLVMTDRTLLAGDAEPAYLPGYGIIAAQTARDLTRHALTPTPAPAPAAPASTAHQTGPANPSTGSTGETGAPGRAWIRRLYTAPSTGQLIAMDSRARIFPHGLAHFIAIRDQLCTTPWCDAPIRHTDHISPWATSQETTITNGRGLCEACNYAKEAPGWNVKATPDPPGPAAPKPVESAEKAPPGTLTTTPTGHTYRYIPPTLPGTRQAKEWQSRR